MEHRHPFFTFTTVYVISSLDWNLRREVTKLAKLEKFSNWGQAQEVAEEFSRYLDSLNLKKEEKERVKDFTQRIRVLTSVEGIKWGIWGP